MSSTKYEKYTLKYNDNGDKGTSIWRETQY